MKHLVIDRLPEIAVDYIHRYVVISRGKLTIILSVRSIYKRGIYYT